MPETTPNDTLSPAGQALRRAYDGLRRLPELPGAYLHPWRRASIQKLAALKNSHQGERCFLVGNGPSLKHTDLVKLRNEFSNTEHLSLSWINKYLLTFAVIVVGGFLSYAFIPLKGFHHHLVIIVFFVFSMYVSRLGILALRQKVVDASIDIDAFLPEVVLQSEIMPIKDEKLIRKLNDYMSKKQVFLEPDLSLTALACTLGTNRTYLSALINQQYGMNFNAYINSLRAEFARNYMEEYPETRKEELCQKAGFGSVSTMNRAMGK